MNKGWVKWTVIVIIGAMILALVAVAGSGSASGQEACPQAEGLTVPGAEGFQVTCLEDLTTLSNPRIDVFTYGWGGSGNRQNSTLSSDLTELPQDPVPGIQIDGWFPDSCSNHEIEHNSFIPPCGNGLRQNGQFVIRIPDEWDGRHLLVAGAPGVRTQFANDIILSDHVLSMGWAYAAHDKGNTGLNFFRAGADEVGDAAPLQWTPPEAIRQWGGFMKLTADAANGVLEQVGEAEAELTYAAGISNGGYQVRLALERYPETFDAGLDWEGTLFTVDGPNLYTYIPPLLRGYPSAAAGDIEGYREVVHGGTVPPDSQPIWENHYSIYWGAVASSYRPVVDPEYSSYIDAPQLIVPPDHPDAQYDYASRPDIVRERVAELSNTGEINGRPLITLHGTLDALLPIASDSDVYARMVRDAGNQENFRYYVVEGGTHVDTAADDHPDSFRPVLPCVWSALADLDTWVIDGTPPPPSGFIGFPADQTPAERANTCALPDPVERVAGAERVATAAAASRRTFGVTQRVVLAPAGEFAPALVAGPLAAITDSPVLLIDPTSEALPPEVVRELERTGAFEALAVGDIGAAALTALEELGLSVETISGDTPAALAAAVATRMATDAESTPTDAAAASRGGTGDAMDEGGAGMGDTAQGVAYIASAESFADSLSASAVAASRGVPLLLTDPDALSPETGQVITGLGVTRTFVAGGPLAVADAVIAELPEAERVAGADRYATSVAMVEHGRSAGLGIEQVYIATGTDFPDALAAAPVAASGEWGAPERGMVLLVHGTAATAGSPESHGWLADNAGAVNRLLLFGGTAAISDAVESRIAEALS